jgi:hypothetical protein
MAEYDGLPFAPILVKDFHSIFGFHKTHVHASILRTAAAI